MTACLRDMAAAGSVTAAILPNDAAVYVGLSQAEWYGGVTHKEDWILTGRVRLLVVSAGVPRLGGAGGR